MALINTVAVIVKMVELNGSNSAGNIKKHTLCGSTVTLTVTTFFPMFLSADYYFTAIVFQMGWGPFNFRHAAIYKINLFMCT